MLHTFSRREESQVGQQEQSRWRPTRRQLLWASGIVAVLTVAVLIGYRYGITLWDWIKLLIVPAAIAGAGLWFNTQQREREQRIADNRAQDDSLQAYLDGMSQLLTDKDLPLHSAQPGDSLSTVARARTLTVLGRLDSGRKRSVLQFLYESGLIYKEQTLFDEGELIEWRHNIVSLQQADLSEVFLMRAYLREASLSAASLNGAHLSEAFLALANLNDAILSEANLSGANLSEATGVTNEQLRVATSLEGATMPDGQKYEDWLKSKDRGENG
jgi:Pentapeptide repeats (8 copies)